MLSRLGAKRLKINKNDHSNPPGAISIVMVNSALKNVTAADFKDVFACPPDTPSRPSPFPMVDFTHTSVFLAGRYNKYSRELSQTPWMIDGELKTELSTQTCLQEHLLQHIIVDEIRFSSAGREDVDVRMLGTGRPFILEVDYS